MSEKPLATIAVMSYNQLEYLKQALEGAIEQTYRPLEILVSDDGSSDGSWEYICQVKAAEERKGVADVSWVINRNEKNLKIVGNWQKMVELSHGEIIVKADGDDVSKPCRVERIVAEWLKSNKSVTVFHSGCDEVDGSGRIIGFSGPRSAEWALGGMSAYAAWIFREFPPLVSGVEVEDQVWAKRAWMVGEEARIDDRLVNYRIGTGISTKFKSIRECWRKRALCMLHGVEILENDLLQRKKIISSERYARVERAIANNRRWAQLTYDAVAHPLLRRRIKALIALMGKMRFALKGWAYLLPYFPTFSRHH